MLAHWPEQVCQLFWLMSILFFSMMRHANIQNWPLSKIIVVANSFELLPCAGPEESTLNINSSITCEAGTIIIPVVNNSKAQIG